MSSLDRFKGAQASSQNGIETALAELRGGSKRGHWIWYVFPQLRGLGMSPLAVSFGLNGAGEAADYLRDPQLRDRLLATTRLVTEQLGTGRVTLEQLMGSAIDARKLVSSLTLFRHVAAQLKDEQLSSLADDVLARAAAEGYPPCAYTLAQISSPSTPGT